jgi:hypothetical protein
MDNQHRKIQTYRELTALEIALINRVKEFERKAAELLELINEGVPFACPRDMALARTHLEDGCIRAVRAIARPLSPFNKE